ncbi:uncharacterized protein BBOV_IV007160 [Babesia bovis T2Bo]|uniref:PHD-type domain-containing protein n=1 Tax=Babesia bovis TaxID=5865 RepID=A7ARA3_BABBO|nr:uncharacterized protein BBOV_IV007160 [Babesia bovis T2Bo]EDO07072.1 hypothetical protein BBOV_IV007160 [Babesia bovis T2Bo]|eukprot:XP_001610640.1 hypothetical protein [Babesia bovis T2Bo]
MSDDLVEDTLGPLLGVSDWLDWLKDRNEVYYYAQNGQYGDFSGLIFNFSPDSSSLPYRGGKGQLSKRCANENECSRDRSVARSGVNPVTFAKDDERPDYASLIRVETHEGFNRSQQTQELVDKSSTRHDVTDILSDEAHTNLDAQTFLNTFGMVDDIHLNYHWNKIDPRILKLARNRGLEPTTLGHVLRRREKLWAKIQCIDKSARSDFEKHLDLYQQQFEHYSKSTDGWVSVTTEHKRDPLFEQPHTYLTGIQNSLKGNEKATEKSNSNHKGKKKPSEDSVKNSKGISVLPRGRYNWNNVIFTPNIGDSSDLIRRYGKKTARLYKNLYDCLVHGWVHPGLVVCEVKDATHPIRFATPPDQDCYTVIYAGPTILDTATQRVVFGEYTGVVYREESLEDSLFEYAFELNFSTAAWINADFDYYEESADITNRGDQVLLPNTSKYVLDSSRACNELSLVNHYQSIKAYGGEKWPFPNCEWQQVFLDGWPHVVLTSKLGVSIKPGDELVADFGALWFSKVEETAHKAIRNEIIQYRLGTIVPSTSIQQLEVPQRPLSSIDIGLKSNTLAAAAAVCSICYISSDDMCELSNEINDGDYESVSCDGCDRFFHIRCIRSLNKASAVNLVKDGLRCKWVVSDTYKGIPQGSGKFYCSYCRHLAKKIYMHDTGYDYMPLLSSVEDRYTSSKRMSPHRNVDVGLYNKPHDITKKCALPASNTVSLNTISGNVNSLAPISCRMRTLANPTYVDLNMVDHDKPSGSEEIQQTLTDSNTSESVISSSSQSEYETLHKNGAKENLTDDLQQYDGKNSVESGSHQQLNSPATNRLGGLHDTIRCVTCMRPLKQNVSDTNQLTNTHDSVSKDKVLLNNYDSVKQSLVSSGNMSITSGASHQSTATLQNNEAELKLNSAKESSSSEPHRVADTVNESQHSFECLISERHTENISGDKHRRPLEKDINVNTVADTVQLDLFDDEDPMKSIKLVNRNKKPAIIVNTSQWIPTENIERAIHFFKAIEKHHNNTTLLSSFDGAVNSRIGEDTTLVDYLGCKYLAGMWQVEPFAHFGDSVKLCTECYNDKGPKANVYVCRLLKRHLGGNFDHPMNTTPSQMRELVLMAYEQHVQMLLRLLVLKNVAINFLCRVCCHFIAKQLFLQKKKNYPPLPFPSYYMGKKLGTPEGLLTKPMGMISKEKIEGKEPLDDDQKEVLQSHLVSFVTSVKNAVVEVPLSSTSDPSISFEMLVQMGALSDEFTRLMNCKDICEYLNDLMSHKVLDGDNIPGQLQQMLTGDELSRFMSFKHLSERFPGPFVASQTAYTNAKKRQRGHADSSLFNIQPGFSYIYRQFKDGYYKGIITNLVDGSEYGTPGFQVGYSDGDDEVITHDDLIVEIIDNLQHMESVIRKLSPNDMRNEDILKAVSEKQTTISVISRKVRRDMMQHLIPSKNTEISKKLDRCNNSYSVGDEEDGESSYGRGSKRKLSNDDNELSDKTL